MSYDVDISWPAHIQAGESFNYTYNCARMFRDALGGDGIHDLHGKKAIGLLPRLERAVAAMESDPERYKAWNPSNGWGDYAGALEFLTKIRDLCRAHPEAEVHVS